MDRLTAHNSAGHEAPIGLTALPVVSTLAGRALYPPRGQRPSCQSQSPPTYRRRRRPDEFDPLRDEGDAYAAALVAAGDTFLQDTLPIIMNSPVWQDPTQKSAIFITWDEDYNNLPLGIGNQGNHVSMIVIPSPGAVASGMRAGPFVAIGYYNHYSLLRTIEDALGLPPLTNNDKYAQPMNEFWT